MLKIEVETGPDSKLTAQLIEQNLLQDIRDTSLQAANVPIVLGEKSEGGILIAGITASTSYNWVNIKTFWVDSTRRRAGLGTKLMQAVHELATEEGCHAAWLDTSSPMAKKFYEKLDYEVFGNISNNSHQFPPLHQRWFMKKSFI